MNGKLLCRYTSSIVADNVANALNVNSIEYRMHDETVDQRNVAYGPNPGIVFYVSEQDYQEASALINPHYKAKFGLAPIELPKCMSRSRWLRNRLSSSCFYILQDTTCYLHHRVVSV